MKPTLLRSLLFSTLFFFSIQLQLTAQNVQSTSTAQKKLIHYWHFNNTLPVGGGGGVHMSKIPADYSTLGHAFLWYRSIGAIKLARDTGYMDNLVGDTINQRAGYAGCCSGGNNAIRTRNPSDSMEFLWYIPTRKYQNIVITYETEASSTASGMHRQLFDYSLDSGATYTTASLPVTFDSSGTAWGKVKLDLTPITGINNTSKLVFRIRYTMPDTSQSGNNRFDNLTIEGDTVASVAGIQEYAAQAPFHCSLFPNPATDQLMIQSSATGPLSLTLYNACGQQLSESQVQGSEFPYSISSLPKGFYYIKLRTASPGQPGRNDEVLLRFIKL
jgi:hypothetical protein